MNPIVMFIIAVFLASSAIAQETLTLGQKNVVSQTGPNLNKRMAVQVQVANVRTGPSKRHNILWKVDKFYPMMVVQEASGWYKLVDFEGDQGWIAKETLDSTTTVIVESWRANVRNGPSTDKTIKFVAERGLSLKVLQRDGAWIEVQHADGEIGWVHNSLVW